MSFQRLKSLFALAISLAALGLCSTACSPSSFFDNGKDKEVSAPKTYRRINTACSGMQLSSAEMDVSTFRSLVSCLNSGGALEPVQQLIDHLSDVDLQPIVDTSNKYLLRNRALLYSFNRTYYALADNQALDETFKEFGRILENEEFVSAGIAVLKDKYFSGRDGNLLKAIEQLAKKVTPDTVADGLDFGLNLADSKAIESLEHRFRGASPRGRSLGEITGNLLQYLRETYDPGHVDPVKAIIQGILANQLLETMDTVVGKTPQELRTRIERVTSILKVQLAKDARLMGGVISLFHYLHKQPISCMGGSKEVHDGVMHVIREMSRIHSENVADYIKRNNVLTLTAMNPLCSYPPELSSYYPRMRELADTAAIEPTADLLKAFYSVKSTAIDGSESHPLAEMVIKMLADSGSGVAGGLREDTSGIRNLIPLFGEINDRGAWDDLLLLATQLRDEERGKLKDGLAFLMAPVPSLQSQSVYDVLIDALSSTSPRHLYDLIYSMRRFVESDEKVLMPSITGLRAAYYVNDVHPVVDLVHDIMADATRNKGFFDTLFMISERNDFKDTVKLFSAMSKDGRLKDLLGVLVSLFERFAMEGKFDVHPATEPAFQSKLRHNLTAADLVHYPPVPEIPEAPEVDDPCGKVDLNQDVSDTSNPKFADQVNFMVACLNSHGKYADVQATIDFLRSVKTEDGRDFFSVSINLVKALGLSSGEMGVLSDKLMQSIDDGRVFRLMDAMPLLTPVVKPLVDVIRPVIGDARSSVRRTQEYGALVLRREEIPSILQYLDELPEQPQPVQAPDPQTFDVDQLSRLAKTKECREDSAARAAEIVQEYRDSITSWDLVDGHPRKGWTLDQFKENVSPLLDRLAARHPANPDRRVYDSLLRFTAYFSLPQGARPNQAQHYHPEYLAKYLYDRSVDYRPITYYYPGESKPRVRLVNSLDRLELVLINADFNAPVIETNFGLKFLAEIAEAWGDEPYDVWPDEIKAKFPNGRGMKTLRQVVDGIKGTQDLFEKMIGFPRFPRCSGHESHEASEDPSEGGAVGWLPDLKKLKPAMFNIHQAISILDQEVENKGLRVLRDIFFQAYYTTPEKYRNPTSPENNLAIILKLVRMGMLRELGRNVRYFEAGDPTLQDLFNALIQGSMTPDIRTLMESLLVKDADRSMLWGLIGEIFKVLGSDGNQSEDAAYFKQLVFYLMALSGQLELTDLVMKNAAAIFSIYSDYLSKHVEHLGTLFQWHEASSVARSLYQETHFEGKKHLAVILRDAMADPSRGVDLVAILKSVDDDRKARDSWEEFSGRLDALVKTPEYKALDLKPIAKDLVRFFEERDIDPAVNATARRIRLYLAERMESGDLDQYLLLARSNPEEFYNALKMMSREIQNGDVKELLNMARRSLSNPPKPGH